MAMGVCLTETRGWWRVDSGGDPTLEWPATLDLDAIAADGWRPTPFRQFLLKVHGRCNLACDYCYVYTKADQSWRHRPSTMAEPVLTKTAARIAEHAQRHGLRAVEVVLHGGEPLLAGRSRLRTMLAGLRSALEPVVPVRFGLQTNGVLLDEEFLRLFAEYDVRLGVSIDGPAAAHDRHRRHRDGRGSHAAVSRALRLLASPRFRSQYGGLLCTVDLANDPVEVYEGLLAFDPPRLDFLLPHGTWSAPPPGKDVRSADAPYGEWLVAVFDRWYGGYGAGPPVRLFDEIIRQLLGGVSRSEVVGTTPTGLVVVETDGAIEQGDSLKVAFDGAPRTGLNVATHPFDAALRLPSIVARQCGVRALAQECTGCRVRRVCGAGLYAHRYRPGRGFHNPTVYCTDLFRLITHVAGAVSAELARVGGAVR